jgi:hypothetical protein
MSCFQHLFKNHLLSDLLAIIHPKLTRDLDALSIFDQPINLPIKLLLLGQVDVV